MKTHHCPQALISRTFFKGLAVGCLVLASALSAWAQGGLEQVSVDGPIDSDSADHYLSGDGRYVAFLNLFCDNADLEECRSTTIVVHDRETGTKTRHGKEGYSIRSFALSETGRYLVYALPWEVTTDTRTSGELFLSDLKTGDVSHLDLFPDEDDSLMDFYDLSISADGRYIAVFSNRYNNENNKTEIYLHDRFAGTTELIPDRPDGNNDVMWAVQHPRISVDGRYIFFVEYGTTTDTSQPCFLVCFPESYNVMLHDRQTGKTRKAMHMDPDGEKRWLRMNEYKFGVNSLSGDGHYLLFSHSDKAVHGEGLFVYDLHTERSTRLNLVFEGAETDGFRQFGISADGRYVYVYLWNNSLNRSGIYVYDRHSGEMRQVNAPGIKAGDDVFISADGRYIGIGIQTAHGNPVYFRENIFITKNPFVALDALSRTPVYRFYNRQSGAHFFTASMDEYDHVLATLPQFSYEGIAFYSYAQAAAGTQGVHRFFNTETGAHFYTISEEERDAILANWPQYKYESIAWYARPNSGDDTSALHRFYLIDESYHFFTSNEEEKDAIITNWPQYKYEGPGYHVWRTQ